MVILLNILYFGTYNKENLNVTFGQKSIISHDKNEQSVDQKGSDFSLKLLSDKNYPYPVFLVDDLIKGPAIIYNGIAISKNASTANITFSKWGYPINLSSKILKWPNKNISFFNLTGIIGNSAAGFITPQLNYSGRYISLNVGSPIKYPESSQVSIKFDIKGESSIYHIVFVNGRLNYESWVNNTLYKKIPGNSNQLIDLVDLVSSKGDKFSYLSNIQITIEKGTIINSFPFRIDLGKSTLITPYVLDKGDTYYVSGYIFGDNIINTNYKYIFDDWKFLQTLNQEFKLNSSHSYKKASNGWIIKNITQTKNSNVSDDVSVNIKSEKNISMGEIPIFDLILHLDFYNSILHFNNSKDILFVLLIASIALSFYPYKKKFHSNNKTKTKSD
jgi:hypothetical protein